MRIFALMKKSILIFFLNIKLYLKKQKQNWQSNSCSFFSPNKFFQLKTIYYICICVFYLKLCSTNCNLHLNPFLWSNIKLIFAQSKRYIKIHLDVIFDLDLSISRSLSLRLLKIDYDAIIIVTHYQNVTKVTILLHMIYQANNGYLSELSSKK